MMRDGFCHKSLLESVLRLFFRDFRYASYADYASRRHNVMAMSVQHWRAPARSSLGGPFDIEHLYK
jgi:hypothetical protein